MTVVQAVGQNSVLEASGGSGCGSSAVSSTPRNGFIRSETVRRLRQEVKSGRYDLLTRIAQSFAEMHGLWNKPICPADRGLVRLIAREVRNNKLPVALGQKVAQGVLSSRTFSLFSFPENVVIRCKDGEVTFNKSLLLLLNSHLRSLLVKTEKDTQGKYHIDFSSTFSRQAVTAVKDYYYGGYIRRDHSLKLLEEIATLAEKLEEPKLLQLSVDESRVVFQEKVTHEFLRELPRDAAFEDTMRPKRYEAIVSLLKASKQHFREVEGTQALLLSLDAAVMYLEGYDLSIYLREFFQGFFFQDSAEVSRMPQVELSFSQETRNLVRQLFVDVVMTAEQLSQAFFLFPNIEKITLCINSITSAMTASSMRDTGTMLSGFLRKTTAAKSLQEMRFICGRLTFEFVLTGELMTALGNSTVSLFLEGQDVLTFEFDKTVAWFQAAPYLGDVATVATLLATSKPLQKGYTQKEPEEHGDKVLIAFDRKRDS